MSNKWDERYQGEGYFYGTEPNDFLREESRRLSRGAKVLCLAEGEGRNAVWLAGQGFEVTAVDGSVVGLQKLQRLADAKGVRVQTVHADLGEFKFQPSSWDAIVSIWCHLPPDLRRQVHQLSQIALKHGGLFLLEAYTPRQLQFKTGGPPTTDLLMQIDDLRRELGDLEILQAVERDREIHEGKGHNGLSAVVQIVALKSEKGHV